MYKSQRILPLGVWDVYYIVYNYQNLICFEFKHLCLREDEADMMCDNHSVLETN